MNTIHSPRKKNFEWKMNFKITIGVLIINHLLVVLVVLARY